MKTTIILIAIVLAMVTASCGLSESIPKKKSITVTLGDTSPEKAQGCGTERWKIKTLTDTNADKINFHARSTTVAKLNTIPSPVAFGSQPFNTRLQEERQVYKMYVNLIQFKFEEDGDIHLVVSGQSLPQTMIVEFPDPDCIKGASPSRRRLMKTARRNLLDSCGLPSKSKFKRLYGDAVIKGVLFMDHFHGAKGAARNAIELHPVTYFKVERNICIHN